MNPALRLPALNPRGRVFLDGPDSGADDALESAFARSSAHGLLALAARRGDSGKWPVELSFWREFADAFLTALAHTPDPSGESAAPAQPGTPMPPELGFQCTLRIPAMRGAEYASPEVFAALWSELDNHARAEALAAGGLRLWLGAINPSLHLLGRVTFHLAENKRSPETPFAFMATYTHRLSAQEKPVHVPLARALQEYAGTKNQGALRSLLEPIRKAAESSPWTRELLESSRVFQPQAWSPAQAHAFLREVPVLEESGIVARIPDWWKGGRGPRPKVSVSVGESRGGGVGVDAMLAFSVGGSLDGKPLTDAEWRTLMQAQDGLVPLRGQWVEVDREKLAGVLDHWKKVESGAAGEGVTFLAAMRLLAGVRLGAAADENAGAEEADWSEVVAGGWLRETLESLRQPDGAAEFDPNEHLAAPLRPYQTAGVKWLWFLQSLGLGACLADDMGLGKTIQVIALLLRLKHGEPPSASGS
ncbi:MAG: SNF2 helicase-associated domain-containing protein, partial [Chthoniobacteraceae bacterium]